MNASGLRTADCLLRAVHHCAFTFAAPTPRQAWLEKTLGEEDGVTAAIKALVALHADPATAGGLMAGASEELQKEVVTKLELSDFGKNFNPMPTMQYNAIHPSIGIVQLH